LFDHSHTGRHVSSVFSAHRLAGTGGTLAKRRAAGAEMT